MVREALSGGWDGAFLRELTTCRAVKASSTYSDLSKIPEEFRNLVFGGAMSLKPPLPRLLSVAGMVLPVNPYRNSEYSVVQDFLRVQWGHGEMLCEVANPLMGWYYQHKFRDSYRTKFKPDKVMPKTCADLLARLVPHLPFYRLVSCPIRGEGGKLHFPSHGRRLPPLKIMHSIQKDMLSQLITKQPLIDLPSLYTDTL